MPVFIPWPPAGEWMWAASPARNVRPDAEVLCHPAVDLVNAGPARGRDPGLHAAVPVEKFLHVAGRKLLLSLQFFRHAPDEPETLLPRHREERVEAVGGEIQVEPSRPELPFHLHVRQEQRLLVSVTLEPKTQRMSHRAARPIRPDHPLRLDSLLLTVGPSDGRRGAIWCLRKAHKLRAPLDMAGLFQPSGQQPLGAVLLVDQGERIGA